MEGPPSSAFTPAVRLVVGLLGAGSFGTGVLAVFVSDNGTGTGVLLAFGGVVLVLALLGGRIESIEFGGAALRLRANAAEKFSLAEQSEQRGDVATADRLRAEARALLDAAGPIAADYRRVRGSLPAGAARTQELDEIVARARRLPTEQRFDPAEVARWLRSGTDEQRIAALGMMQASPELRDVDAVLAAVAVPRTAFEHYHALRLVLQMVDDLDAAQRQRLAAAIRSHRWTRLRWDSARRRLRDQVLQRLPEAASH
jgi:hypothetical protein